MRTVFTRITDLGEYLTSLPNLTKKWLVLGALLVLAGGSVYKLIRSINKLNEPLPVATTDQLINPMSEMVRQVSTKANTYQLKRNQQLKQLDSLAKIINANKTTSHGNRSLTN